MGICRSCFHSPTDDSASNERSPLHYPKTYALYQQDRAATAWNQCPTQGNEGRFTDALQSQELNAFTCEGRPNASFVKTVELSHEVGDGDSALCSAATGTPAPLSLSAVNKANYHQLSVMLGIESEDARRLIEGRPVAKGFDTLDALLSVSGITPDARHKIGQKLSMYRGHEQVHYLGRVMQKGTVPSAVRVAPFWEGESLLRVATWNLQQFTTVKASSQPLLDAVCDVIINSGVDVLAVQELGSQAALEMVCKELSHRGTHHWEFVVSDSVGRMFQGLEYHGLLWKTECARLCQSGLLGRPSNKNDTQFVRTVFMGVFKVRGVSTEVMLASVHLKAVGFGNAGLEQLKSEVRMLPALCSAIQESTGGRKVLVLLGDFNMAPDKEDFNALINQGYVHILPGNVPTNISVTNLEGSSCYDNIWVSQVTYSTAFTGCFDVVRSGLVYQGGNNGTATCVSDHCPVWAEFNFQARHE